MGVLSVLGLTEVEEPAYAAVVATGSATTTEIARATQVAPRPLNAALESLRERGLIAASLGTEQRWAVTPPEPALDALVHAHQHALALVRTHAQFLTEQVREHSQRRRPDELVALAEGNEAINSHFEQLQRSAEREVLVFDRPPYSSTGGVVPNELQKERIDAGVTYRTVYDLGVLDAPDLVARVKIDVAFGEQARIMPDVPLKLAIADRTMALVPLINADSGSRPAALVIRPSVLLESLAALFEALWQRAMPLTFDTDGPPSADPELVEVVQLLAVGMTDGRIARHLQTSERTVRRKIAAAMQVLGASTRFQAGMLAQSNGWLHGSG